MASKKPSGLGRGLGALLGDDVMNTETQGAMYLPISEVESNSAQPRKFFDEAALAELADSIRQHGILQPLSVRRVGNQYELVSGERRLRAAELAGVTDIPCILMSMDEKESCLAALVENLQRQDLNYVEEAIGIRRLLEQWGMSQEQAARLLGKSQSAVANKLRLLKHGEAVLDALREAKLTERHARALLRLRSEEEKLSAIREIVQRDLNVARTEKYIDALLSGQEPVPRGANVSAFLNSLSASVQKIQRSGIRAVSERRETDSQIVLTITIPK